MKLFFVFVFLTSLKAQAKSELCTAENLTILTKKVMTMFNYSMDKHSFTNKVMIGALKNKESFIEFFKKYDLGNQQFSNNMQKSSADLAEFVKQHPECNIDGMFINKINK